MLSPFITAATKTIEIFFKKFLYFIIFGCIMALLTIGLQTLTLLNTDTVRFQQVALIFGASLIGFVVALAAQRILTRLLLDFTRSISFSWQRITQEISVSKLARFGILNIVIGLPTGITNYLITSHNLEYTSISTLLRIAAAIFFTATNLYAAIIHVDTGKGIAGSLRSSWTLFKHSLSSSLVLSLLYYLVAQTIALKSPINPSTIGVRLDVTSLIIIFFALIVQELLFNMYQLLRVATYEQILTDK